MGNGRVDGDKLNFQVTADFAMSPNDAFRWRCAFTKASELLHNATEGQLQFGKIFVTNDGLGLANADYRVVDVGDRAFATFGGFGQAGRSVTLPPYVQTQVLSLVHESGHHVFGLGEEYSFALSEAVDTDATLPATHNNSIIPLVSATSSRPDSDFVDATAILSFGGQLFTRDVVSRVGDRVTVDSPYPQDPRDDSSVTFQWPADCTDDRTTGACIMEFSRSNAGEMSAGCTWTPATDPVTEFCTGANHDPDADTDQTSRNGEPCWTSIVDRFGSLTPPAAGSAATKTAPAGFTPPTWIALEPNLRVALVLDRSGSMDRDGGARLAGVKTGATYWIENAALESDRLTVVWYSTGTSTPLPLTDVSSLSTGQRDALVAAIATQTADGGTNIRDALREGLTELLSPGTAAAVQATLLMTDGAHNTPIFSSMREAVPEFQQANTTIHTLGVGSGAEVDRPGLAALSAATNGGAWTVDDGSDTVAITDRMIQANNLIRGGIITSPAEIMPDLEEPLADHGDERPSTKELLKLLGLKDLGDLDRILRRARGLLVGTVHEVEPGATSATFNLSYQAGMGLWLYLVAPDGSLVDSSTPGVRFVTTREGFELAKVPHPAPGRWTILGYRSRPGSVGFVRVTTGIQNPAITVTASAAAAESGMPTEISATVHHGGELVGARVTATLREVSGATFTIPLRDDDRVGHYIGLVALPDGSYEGLVDVLAPGDAERGGQLHAILHAEAGEDLGPDRLGNPRFRRHVPIGVTVGGRTPDEVPEEEREGISDKDDGRPVDVDIRSWEPEKAW